jgi:hypothetical protein
MEREKVVSGDSESVAALTRRTNQDSLLTVHPCTLCVRPGDSEMCVGYGTVGTKGIGHHDRR